MCGYVRVCISVIVCVCVGSNIVCLFGINNNAVVIRPYL